mgnify:CR=1 FL=1
MDIRAARSADVIDIFNSFVIPKLKEKNYSFELKNQTLPY